MHNARISALVMALALEWVQPVAADEWAGAHLTFGLSSAVVDLNSSGGDATFGASQDDIGPYAAMGYDWDFGSFSLGGVFDIEATGARDAIIVGGKAVLNETDWFATLRARVGVPLNDELRLFASAGAGAMPLRGVVGSADLEADQTTAFGLATGLGFEYQLSPGRHLTVEYLHADFNRAPLFEDALAADPDVNSLRIGYTIRF